ncbi:MAG: hypothetical protein DKM50_01100 [Candidatus Margulisiibacteriota bacterium]|nr:MAG: hypothetical protein A2X42_04790 [Candidatus Margulisbacteria bacterium GWF2_38_17]OGI06903.1 MAG: hypothetical protein A2X41_10495 [Candidatus Margulisbacteria bacterium GWE2_39_32]PZM83869.1 MAG: hypothetical protein DKM50_01100 [Candidatus Margulisiibacteriota bacterium]HCT85231.1 hypothetical protein [Candidatus Margulisiibacteriota bacterium]HCY35737.1 hypothetical protein [Candidatus Margulisiibacteriota bacterium]
MKQDQSNPLIPRQAILENKFPETSDTCSVKIALTDNDGFSFKPGQFNMLGIPGFGETPVSFSSLMLDKNSFMHTIRSVGNVTDAICKLNIGEQLNLRGPFGNGWPTEKVTNKNILLIAGGIGIAPLRPVIHLLLKNHLNYRKLFLLYGARTDRDMLFKNEIKEWTESKNISVLLSVDEKSTENLIDARVGLITSLLDELKVPWQESIAFICGPEIMMRFVSRYLIIHGMNSKDVFVSMERMMKCGIAACGHCQIGAKFVCKDGPVFAYPDIKRFADTLL